MSTTKYKEPWRQRVAQEGFSLVEAVVSVAIVAVLLVAALGTIGASARARLIGADQSRGVALAGQLLSEIMQCRYADPNLPPVFGPEAGEARVDFDDVDDFNGYQESPPRMRDGSAIAGFDAWKRSVQVDWVSPGNPPSPAATDTGLKRIIVTATGPAGKAVSLTGLRCRYGAYERRMTWQTTYMSWAGVSLQVGGEANRTAMSGVNPLNQVP